jgi:hypothetical protein
MPAFTTGRKENIRSDQRDPKELSKRLFSGNKRLLQEPVATFPKFGLAGAVVIT